VIYQAPAKLNLFLHITGKRADGYHLLESLVAFTAFGDAVEIVPDAELSLAVEGEFAHLLPVVGDDNLIMRAARLLRQKSAGAGGAKIILRKSIPVGAGLGGGSTDAACVLRALAALWKVELQARDFATLGSDIPACLAAMPAWVGGVGEQVRPVAMATGAWVVLVNPRMPLLTAEVYGRVSDARCQVSDKKEFSSDTRHPAPDTISSFDTLLSLLCSTRNDLEAPALELMPVIGDILAAVRATEGCALARMSGSGATCFGLYRSENEARQAAEYIRKTHPLWWCVATNIKEGQHGQA